MISNESYMWAYRYVQYSNPLISLIWDVRNAMLSWFDLISNVTFFMPSVYDVSWKIYNSGVFKYKPKLILFRVVYLNINKCICMCAWFLTYDQDAWLSTIGGVFSPKWDSKKPHSNIRNIETLFFISIFKRRNVFFHLPLYYREP